MAEEMDRPLNYARGDRDIGYRQGSSGTGNTEHWLGWLFGLIALVLGVIGLLAGFGIFGGDVSAQATPDNAASLANWQDGWLWMMAALSSGLIAFTLHSSDHHQHTEMSKADRGMFGTEHLLAYLLALAAIASGVIGLLVGWDIFDNGNTFEDGMLWLGASVLCAILSATTHAVRHHAWAEDEEYVATIVERRVGMMSTPPPTATTTPAPVREEPRQF